MNIFLSYLTSRWQALVFFLLSGIILCISFGLYHLPLQAILYPLILCLLLGLVFCASGFLRYRQRHRMLLELSELNGLAADLLPPPETLPEADYQALVENLCREAADLQVRDTAAFREMVDYYTVWAHQIKTPIASMKLSLQNQDVPMARQLRSDLFRIEQYVDMVLAFLRLGSDDSDYVFREHDLDSIIRQSVRKFAPEFIGRKIGLSYEGIHRTLITDEKWLAFVLEQLLSNALKYTRAGSVTIYLQDEDTLCIADTGMGIAPEDLPRIFHKGFTGANGRLDKSASGLGLYLCKTTCDRLGIQLSASSEVGKGTTLSLYFKQYPLKTE